MEGFGKKSDEDRKIMNKILKYRDKPNSIQHLDQWGNRFLPHRPNMRQI